MEMITCTKVYHSEKVDKKNRKYDLISMYTKDQKKFVIFDYDFAYSGLVDGDSFDISPYDQTPNEFNGKTSIILNKKKKSVQATIPVEFEERIATLETAVAAIKKYLNETHKP